MRALYDARHEHRLGLRLPFMEYLYTQPARLRAEIFLAQAARPLSGLQGALEGGEG